MKPANLFNNSFKWGTPKWHYILSSLSHVKELKVLDSVLKDESVLGAYILESNEGMDNFLFTQIL